MRLQQKRFGKAERVSSRSTNMSLLTEIFSENFLKKLVGRTDIEDALKRLDKLTQEEARMATAQVLKVAHTVDNKVAGVDDRVASVGDKVKVVDDKVAEVLDGAQYIFNRSLIKFNTCA